jgi:hypothetical protein
MTDTYSLDTPNISIFDKKPKKKRQSLYTEEEKIQKHRDNSTKYYNDNYEYVKLKNRIQAKIRYDTQKAKTLIN